MTPASPLSLIAATGAPSQPPPPIAAGAPELAFLDLLSAMLPPEWREGVPTFAFDDAQARGDGFGGPEDRDQAGRTESGSSESSEESADGDSAGGTHQELPPPIPVFLLPSFPSPPLATVEFETPKPHRAPTESAPVSATQATGGMVHADTVPTPSPATRPATRGFEAPSGEFALPEVPAAAQPRSPAVTETMTKATSVDEVKAMAEAPRARPAEADSRQPFPKSPPLRENPGGRESPGGNDGLSQSATQPSLFAADSSAVADRGPAMQQAAPSLYGKEEPKGRPVFLRPPPEPGIEAPHPLPSKHDEPAESEPAESEMLPDKDIALLTPAEARSPVGDKHFPKEPQGEEPQGVVHDERTRGANVQPSVSKPPVSRVPRTEQALQGTSLRDTTPPIESPRIDVAAVPMPPGRSVLESAVAERPQPREAGVSSASNRAETTPLAAPTLFAPAETRRERPDTIATTVFEADRPPAIRLQLTAIDASTVAARSVPEPSLDAKNSTAPPAEPKTERKFASAEAVVQETPRRTAAAVQRGPEKPAPLVEPAAPGPPSSAHAPSHKQDSPEPAPTLRTAVRPVVHSSPATSPRQADAARREDSAREPAAARIPQPAAFGDEPAHAKESVGRQRTMAEPGAPRLEFQTVPSTPVVTALPARFDHSGDSGARPIPTEPSDGRTDAALVTEPARAEPRASGAVREVRLILDGPGHQPVEIKAANRPGGIEVALRTASEPVTAALRGELRTLIESLERTGYRTTEIGSTPALPGSESAAAGERTPDRGESFPIEPPAWSHRPPAVHGTATETSPDGRRSAPREQEPRKPRRRPIPEFSIGAVLQEGNIP